MFSFCIFILSCRPRSEVPRSSSTARSSSSASISSNTSSTHPRPTSQPNFNNHQLQELSFSQICFVLFFFFSFQLFSFNFSSYYFKLIYDLTKYCRGLRTWIRGTQLSSPPPRPRPPARAGAGAGAGAADPPRARAGPSSLTTPLQRLLKQPGELPSQALQPLANTQTLTIMHLVTATPRPRTKGVPAMRCWRLARTDAVRVAATCRAGPSSPPAPAPRPPARPRTGPRSSAPASTLAWPRLAATRPGQSEIFSSF